MTTALAQTTHYYIFEIRELDSNALSRLSQVIKQMIELVSLILLLLYKVQPAIELMIDTILAVEYSYKVVSIVVNSLIFALR